MSHKSTSYKLFTWINYTFLICISLLCVLPLVHILAVSFSGRAAANANLVGLLPIDFTWESYGMTLLNHNFTRSLWIAFARTILGTLVSMIVIILAAYPLSKTESFSKMRSVYIWFFVFTMLFSGGLVPSYLVVQKLGLMNSLWALILPGAVSVYNMILLLNFFRSISKELEEAAFMDGAGYVRTLWSVMIPISAPALATLSLFTIVGHWNSWFDGFIYMTDYRNYPLATFLQTIIVKQDFSKLNVKPEDVQNISQRAVNAAQIFIGALPILLIYPMLQRFFMKGIVLGAIKE